MTTTQRTPIVGEDIWYWHDGQRFSAKVLTVLSSTEIHVHYTTPLDPRSRTAEHVPLIKTQRDKKHGFTYL